MDGGGENSCFAFACVEKPRSEQTGNSEAATVVIRELPE
jgi:hypothetical protein